MPKKQKLKKQKSKKLSKRNKKSLSIKLERLFYFLLDDLAETDLKISLT